jgi:hypothetical protein
MNRKPKAEIVLFLICVTILLAPLALRGTSCGQDFDFHLESWMEVAQQWRHGILYPHWASFANYGAGEPRFVFYPPLSWMLGAFLGIILPWTWTPMAFALIVLLSMGAAFYKMAVQWMPKDSAAFAATLYILSPYIVFVIYERTAYAEFLAAVWIPLLILYALREKPSTLQLALTVAALWLTNAPAAVMGCYTLAVIATVVAIHQRNWKYIVRAASGLALGLGLSAIYLIPAIYEQRWVEIARAIGPGMRIQDSFLFEHTGMAYHDMVLRTVSWIATILIAATIAAAVLSLKARRSNPLRNPLLVVAALIIFLQFSASRFLWDAAPKLRYLQFPWRWLLVLGLVFAALAGILLSSEHRQKSTAQEPPLFPEMEMKTAPPAHGLYYRRVLILLLIAGTFTAHVWKHTWLRCDDEDNIRAQIVTLNDGGFEGTDEYTTKGIDNADIQQDLPQIRVVNGPDADQADSTNEENPDWDPSDKTIQQAQLPANIHIQRWQPAHMTATISSRQAGYAVLRLMDYPAWRVWANNLPVKSRVQRDDGLLVLPITPGTTTIDVKYTTTPDVWAGRLVSLLSLLLWLWLAAKTRREQV